MKIQFKNYWDEVDEYPIYSIHYTVLDGKPIDIVIVGYEEVLQEIAEKHCILGFNIVSLDDSASSILNFFEAERALKFHATHEALYGRLQDFEVVDAYDVKMFCDRVNDN